MFPSGTRLACEHPYFTLVVAGIAQEVCPDMLGIIRVCYLGGGCAISGTMKLIFLCGKNLVLLRWLLSDNLNGAPIISDKAKE